jgi:GNAT superfamily N-acetyltransferase
LNTQLIAVCQTYVACFNAKPVAFIAVKKVKMRTQYCAVSRLVVIPDYQGIGIGKRLLNWAAEYYTQKTHFPFFIVTSNPQLIRARMANWKLRRIGHLTKDKKHSFNLQHYKALSGHRLTATLQYCPPQESHKPL